MVKLNPLQIGAFLTETSITTRHRECSVINLTIEVLPGVNPQQVVDRIHIALHGEPEPEKDNLARKITFTDT